MISYHHGWQTPNRDRLTLLDTKWMSKYVLCSVSYHNVWWCFVLSRVALFRIILYCMVIFCVVCGNALCILEDRFVLCVFHCVCPEVNLPDCSWHVRRTWGLSVNVKVRETQYSFMYMCIPSLIMCVLLHVCVCACMCVCMLSQR